MLMLLGVSQLCAQGELTAVSVEVDIADSVLQVRQAFSLSLADSVTSFDIKALQFEGTSLDFLTASLEGDDLVLEDIPEQGMNRLRVSKAEGKTWSRVVCKYEVKVRGKQFYLPLFFTNFSAASSQNDFFSIQMRMPKTQNHTVLFPTVKWEEAASQTDKVIRFEVPALPAFLRLKRQDGEKAEIALNDAVDIGAAFLFLGIGLLIWVNRKRLSYG